MNNVRESTAVIVDVVRSRSYVDRAALQKAVEDALRAAGSETAPLQPFSATVGDEFQAVYTTRDQALAATLRLQLTLPDGVTLRFGIGEGQTHHVPSSTSTDIQDGPGWWRAREAIEHAEHVQARHPYVRSWFRGSDQADQAIVNAYLLAKDHLVASMNVRARSYAQGVLEDLTQAQIAQQHSVTQSAVSQSLRRSGAAALIEGLHALTAHAPRSARTSLPAEEDGV